MNSSRLPAPFGQLIERSRKVSFTFEGREVEGYAGDTISSALAAPAAGSCRARSNITGRAASFPPPGSTTSPRG